MTRIARTLALLVVVTVTLAAPRLAEACSVCFNDPDSPQTRGASMAVLFMLGVVGAVLGGFAIFFVYLIRRFRHFGDRAVEMTPAERRPH